MSTLKIIALLSLALDFILIVAYIELNSIKRYYKRQFEFRPRAFVYVEKYSWQRKFVDLLLLRRPVAIKQPFKMVKVNERKRIRTEN
jgi:hypothetical protein